MARIELTAGDDIYVHAEADKNEWNDIHGLAGNDSFKLYQGDAEGGKGNDRIEKMPVPNEAWRTVGAAYWDSPAAVTVNLAEGWADDGWGGRDTLVNVDGAHGTGYNDVFVGSAGDNYFWANGGKDIIDGGAGTNDRVGIGWFQPAPGVDWRQALLSDLDIKVGVDGETAVIKPKGPGTGFEYQLTRVEYLEVPLVTGGNYQRVLLSDYITQQDMAQQAIVAGGVARWNPLQSLGSSVTVSFSFESSAPASGVGASGFRAFTAAEQQLVRDLLAKTSVFSGISFTEVANGQMRFGVSQQTDTRGVSWLPGVANGEQAGDVWMDVESMLNLAPGSEGYAVLLHEVGHALGLRHPRNTDVGDAWSVQLRASDDRSSLTAMSETPSADGLFRADWGVLDVLALRHLYGGKLVNAGDTVYQLGSSQAMSQTTVIDDGGIDTLDASTYAAGVSINLMPGGLSNVGLTSIGNAGVENLGITATSLIENAVGSAYDDVLQGNDADNRLTGGYGNDWIDGGKGVDTAVFSGRMADYVISSDFGKVFVEARNGRTGFDTLLNVEKLAFDDKTVSVGQALAGRATASDFDGDGKSDLLWRNGASGEGTIWLGASAANGAAVAAVSNTKWSVVGMGDFDGDGKSDLLWRNADSGEGSIWKSGSAATTMDVAAVVNLNWKVTGIGDFDGDGKSDILWRSATSGEGTIWKGGSAAMTMDVAAVVNLNWKVAGIGDFDGDGKSDILWRSATSGEGTIWKGGSAATPMDVAAVVNLNWKVVGIGDFDGDGKSDLLWRNDLSGQATIWKSASAATPMDVLSVSNLNWRIAAVGDYDGDGKSDLLWRNGATGEATIWKGAVASAGMDVLQVANTNWKVIGGAVTQLSENGVALNASASQLDGSELLRFDALGEPGEQALTTAIDAQVGAATAAATAGTEAHAELAGWAGFAGSDWTQAHAQDSGASQHHLGLSGADYLLA